MSSTFRAIGVGLMLLAIGAPVSGQLCLGDPALGGNAAGNLAAAMTFYDGGKQFSAGGTFGSPWFLSGSFTYDDFDNSSLSVKSISAGVGYELARTELGISICPTVSAGYSFGLQLLGVDLTSIGIAPALAIGVDVDVSPSMVVAPFGRGVLIYERATGDAGSAGSYTTSDTFGALIVGAGLVFNRKFSVVPSMRIPIASDADETFYGIGMAVAVGNP